MHSNFDSCGVERVPLCTHAVLSVHALLVLLQVAVRADQSAVRESVKRAALNGCQLVY
jgi:hypothetical protein